MSRDFREGVVKDFDGLDEIGLFDNERRSEAADGVMRLLGQNPTPQHGKAYGGSTHQSWIKFDPGPKPLAANCNDGRMARARKPAHKRLAEDLAAQREVCLLEDGNGFPPPGRSEGIAAKSRPMAAGIKNIHNGALGDKSGNRHKAAAKRLTKDKTVGKRVLVFKTKVTAGAPKAGLDFVE